MTLGFLPPSKRVEGNSVVDFFHLNCNTLQHTATHCNTLQCPRDFREGMHTTTKGDSVKAF